MQYINFFRKKCVEIRKVHQYYCTIFVLDVIYIFLTDINDKAEFTCIK